MILNFNLPSIWSAGNWKSGSSAPNLGWIRPDDLFARFRSIPSGIGYWSYCWEGGYPFPTAVIRPFPWGSSLNWLGWIVTWVGLLLLLVILWVQGHRLIYSSWPLRISTQILVISSQKNFYHNHWIEPVHSVPLKLSAFCRLWGICKSWS